jgi:hypothetical protein
MSWFREIAEWKVSNSTLYINIGDVRSEWLFIPLDDPEDQRRLLSLQLTGAWLSEAIELSVDLVSPLAGRCGRYPSATMGGCTWMGIIIDTNLPSENSPWYKAHGDRHPTGLFKFSSNRAACRTMLKICNGCIKPPKRLSLRKMTLEG